MSKIVFVSIDYGVIQRGVSLVSVLGMVVEARKVCGRLGKIVPRNETMGVNEE